MVKTNTLQFFAPIQVTGVLLDMAVGKESSKDVIDIDESVLANGKFTIKWVRIEFMDGMEIRKTWY